MNIGFTGKAQNALNRALYTASEMGHTCGGRENRLLGLLCEKDGLAGRVRRERGVTYARAERVLREGEAPGPGI